MDLRHIFAIGDCAETGAIQAGHTAYWQAEVAARNVCRLIEKEEGREKETLESYKPGKPCIKLTLGLVSVHFRLSGSRKETDE
jgi:NADH dehydrogenase FAD-containing subunit